MENAVKALGVSYRRESSFRISYGVLSVDRFLLTIRAADTPNVRERSLEICDRLLMPRHLRAAAQRVFRRASYVHYGFERAGERITCKLYLEKAVGRGEVLRARARNTPIVLYKGFKWDPVQTMSVVTRYLWRPFLSISEIDQRLSNCFPDSRNAKCEIAKEMLSLATREIPGESIEYAEVVEAGTLRRSFDLNLYNAKLEMRNAAFLLARTCEAFCVGRQARQALMNGVRRELLGHVAGGIDRNGDEFLTFYHSTRDLLRGADPLVLQPST
jgi:tryptophan halogenase